MKMIINSILLIVLLSASGCFSCYKTYAHNRNVNAQIVQVRATESGDVEGRINLLVLNKGYFSAWKEDTVGMTVATMGDIVSGAVIYSVIEKEMDVDLSFSLKLTHQPKSETTEQ